MTRISLDLRERIFEARQSGESTAEVAERFAVSPAFVRRLLQRYRETGSLAVSSARRGPVPRLADQYERIRDFQAQHSGLTAAESRDRLRLKASPLIVWRNLKRLGRTFKKSRFKPPNSSVPK